MTKWAGTLTLLNRVESSTSWTTTRDYWLLVHSVLIFPGRDVGRTGKHLGAEGRKIAALLFGCDIGIGRQQTSVLPTLPRCVSRWPESATYLWLTRYWGKNFGTADATSCVFVWHGLNFSYPVCCQCHDLFRCWSSSLAKVMHVRSSAYYSSLVLVSAVWVFVSSNDSKVSSKLQNLSILITISFYITIIL